MSEESTASWFVRDDPLADLSERDHFGHGAYSEVLAEAVLQATPPFTIGVFGTWGVGKTTITKSYLDAVLRKKAGSKKIAYAYFDVWKYEGDSLRRQFLREVAEQFKSADVLERKYDQKKELRDLVEDSREPVETNIKVSPRQLGVAVIRGALAFAVTFLAMRVLQKLDLIKTGTDLPLSLMVGVLSAFIGEARQVIVVGQREVARKSIDAPDLFEQKFRDLMNNVTAERAVIVVDNLDRCSPDRVMEVLSTIKTFLEPAATRVQPVFVVPCDHQAIRRHLASRGEIGEGDADEYLRKFFNATLRINPILEEEIREYVFEVLSGLTLAAGVTDDLKRELVQVITVAFRGNPRRVKQFLNTLTSKLMLLRQRERQKFISPPISGEIPFLAKLTIIEEEWPEFYRAIQEDVRSYEQLSELAIGIQTEVPGQLADFAKNERLLSFLRGTRGTASTSVRAFTRLKLAPVERKIANYSQYRNALLDGRLEELAAILADVTSEALPPYHEAAGEILRGEVENGYYESALNVIDSIIRTEQLAAPALAREVVERLYSVQQLRALLPSLAPQETLVFLSHVDSGASDLLVGEFLKLLPQESLGSYVPKERMAKWQTEVAKGLASLNDRLDAARERELKELCSGSLAQNLQFVYELTRLPNGASRFVSPEAVAAAVSRIDPNNLKLKDDGSLQHSFASALWSRGRPFVGDENVLAFVQRVTELLAQIPADPAAPGREPLLLLLLESREVLSRAASPASDRLAEQLRSHYQSTQSHRRWVVMAILGSLYSALSASWLQEAQSLFTQFANTESIADVGALVAFATKEGIEALPEQLRSVLWTRLKERFKTSTQTQDHQGIAGLFVTHADDLGWSHVQALFDLAIDARNVPALVNALATHKDTIGERQSGLVAATLSRLLLALPNFPPGEQALAFQGVWPLADVMDDENRMRLRDYVVKLISSDDPAVRSVGLDALTEAESRKVFSETERRHVVEQLVLWLLGRTDRLDESYRPLFDRILKDASLVEESTLDNVITVMKALLARHSGMSALAASYLSSLPLPTKRRDEVLQELVHAAREEPDVNQRHQLVKRANDMANKDRRTKGAKALATYLGELRQGAEVDRALANELLGQEGAES